MHLTSNDLEKLQQVFAEKHFDYQMELVDGKVTVMGPSDYTSDEIGSRLITFLNMWVMPRALGRVTGAAAGFILPNTNEDVRAPDVSFVIAERLRRSPRGFADLIPDLMVEIKSKTDRIKPLETKIQQFLSLGTQVGMLIDPDKEIVTIYRQGAQAKMLTNKDMLTIPDLLPDWGVAVTELWPPVFD